ncbi:acyltransferase 3 [Luminiphilus syltensis NOR5-1B]|uniref:Acyltransferase 3 n=1 Tax=Luminiphilus syltensis NOR5-1B TaxID=565045 RepID=B8KTL7_9GAMM|nr:acyltransferase [Luminiphilus syltensis]EED34813.1 acyltransferase 3 [Luminiphilus syltensis NOR5-1B]
MVKPRTNLTDIDGLRAIAVLGVVLFHLQVSGFAGGYVGVDIFFVISGFLITGILKDQLISGEFSFGAFYGRRVRRLFPAILATVFATTLAALFVLQPLELEAFAKSGVAAIASGANILFYLEAGYWDADSALKPLLHLWSLGVEEQFYLLWPALLWLLFRSCRPSSNAYITTLVALLLLSFGLSVYFTDRDQPAAFYLLPFRAWQFCLGAVALELWQRLHISLFSQQLVRSAGLALCCIGFVVLEDGSSFPGWQALIPSIGAALVLVAANADEPSPLLSNRPARWVGQISFSLYLAHWPPIALLSSWYLTPLTTPSRLALAAIITLATLVLYYGVERRFYQRHSYQSDNGRLTVYGSIVIAVLLAACLTFIAFQPARFGYQEVQLDAAAIKHYKRERDSLIDAGCRIDQLDDPSRCPASLVEPILVFGNSHEKDAFNFLTTALPASRSPSIVYFGGVGGCGKMTPEGVFTREEDWVVAASDSCQKRIDALWESLESVEWSMVLYSSKSPFARNKTDILHILQTIKTRQPSVKIALMGGLISTTRECAFFINRFGNSRACIRPGALSKYYADPKNDGGAVYYEDFMALGDLYIDKAGLVCTSPVDVQSCETETPEGHPMFVDRHHLTLPYAQLLGRRYLERYPDWYRDLTAK